MPPPPTNPIHLYRSLLREVTYLFDTKSHSILPSYIHDAFASHRDVTDRTHLTAHLKLGRRTHSLLIRANAGDPKACLRVLRWTYTRKGKPRREQLAPLLTNELEDPLIPEELQTRTPKILPQLEALARAQQGRVKKLTPVVPETNIYGQPFPKRREANLKKKVYREALKKLLPPIEVGEMRLLEKLVTGELDMPVRKRRSRPKGEGEMDAGEVRRRVVLSGVDGHYITKQFRRRLYTQILAESPRLFHLESGEDYIDEDRGEVDGEDEESEIDDQRTRGAKEEVGTIEPEQVGRWKASFSPLGRGKKPIFGLEEEFAEDEDNRTKNKHSGGRGAPGLVAIKKKEKLKGDV